MTTNLVNAASMMASPGAEDPINITFIVRPFPHGPSLDGAFRVHIPSKDLEALKIRPGEICQLCTAEGTIGTGIAWRSNDVVAKANTHPVKLTDTFRDAFNFKLGNQITITRSPVQIYHADRVIVTDVSDHNTSDDGRDDENWRWRCGYILGNVEAIANGIAFEATSRKGLRKRFLIESINSSTRDTNCLFFFNDRTQLIMQDESAGPTPAPRTESLRLSNVGIGGLDQQLEQLNQRLDLFLGIVAGRRIPDRHRKNPGILLHGPSGTGKSLIIRQLMQKPWRKVFQIREYMLPGTPSRSQAVISGIITEALAQQPSLVVLDDIHKIAGSQKDDFALSPSLLADELQRIKDSKVLLVAAAPSIAEVSKDLRRLGLLQYELELPVPDEPARLQILQILAAARVSTITDNHNRVLQTVAERTHGYVGEDLGLLNDTALMHATRRYYSAAWSRTNGSGDSFATLVDGNFHRGHVSTRPSVSTISSYDHPLNSQADDIDIQLQDFEQALLEVRPSAMREVFLERPNVQWSEVGGSDETRRVLSRAVEWPIKKKSEMAQLQKNPKKGILLYGPPGCSKTMTAKAIATSSGINFLAVKGAELISKYVGESERAVREVFRKARAAAPSIIFLDEVDSIGAERDSNATNGLHVLTTLLNEMDGIESLNGVLVLAATNKPETLDNALLRPGRFDTLHYIGPPNEAARLEIFKLKTERLPLDGDIDLRALARQTDGFSGAEVVAICDVATDVTIERWDRLPRNARFTVAKSDFDRALDGAKRRITPAMIAGYEAWRAGLRD